MDYSAEQIHINPKKTAWRADLSVVERNNTALEQCHNLWYNVKKERKLNI